MTVTMHEQHDIEGNDDRVAPSPVKPQPSSRDLSVVGQPAPERLGLKSPNKSRDQPKGRPGWKPDYLRRRATIAIFALFVFETAGLITLYCYSNMHGGLIKVPPRHHQLWKYGPTAGMCSMEIPT
jgi:hypothetical protein